jgi:hypothetical protein
MINGALMVLLFVLGVLGEIALAQKILHFVIWKDPTEGAFSGMVPKGWTVKGGIERPYYDATFQFLAEEKPQGDTFIFFSYPAPYLFIEPSSSLQMLGYFEGGQFNMGPGLKPAPVIHYHSAREYIQNIIFPQLTDQYPETQILTIQDRSDLLEVYRDPVATEQSVADALIKFDYGGRTLQVGYVVITYRVWIQMADFGAWTVSLMGCQAPKDKFDSVARIYSQILPTFRMNPQWVRAEIAGRAQRQALIRSTYQRIIDMDYRMWQEESRVRERIARGWINALGGTQEMEDPETGERYMVPYGPDLNHFWIKGTETVATQLDEAPDIGFTRLREVR